MITKLDNGKWAVLDETHEIEFIGDTLEDIEKWIRGEQE